MSFKILAAEDDALLRFVLADLLKDYQVDFANSGREAFSMARVKNYDLVLSDVQMRNGDGRFLLEQINLISNRPPFIFLTSSEQIAESESYRIGAQALLKKGRWGLLKAFVEIFNISSK